MEALDENEDEIGEGEMQNLNIDGKYTHSLPKFMSSLSVTLDFLFFFQTADSPMRTRIDFSEKYFACLDIL